LEQALSHGGDSNTERCAFFEGNVVAKKNLHIAFGGDVFGECAVFMLL
jgi:hypothetical protein